VLDAGGGDHSVFAKAFLDALGSNNEVLDGQSLFDAIKRPVALNAYQTPDYADIQRAGHAGGDFLFVPVKVEVTVTVAAPEAAPSSEAVTAQQEMLFWQSIQNSTEPAMFDEYLRQFPGGMFAGLAKLKRDALLDAPKQETRVAAVVPPPEAAITVEEMDATFVALKTAKVRSEPTTEAERVGRLPRDSAVTVTGKVTDKNWYRIDYEGETAYVFGTLVEEVDSDEIAAWRLVSKSSDPEVFSAFLDDYPDGHFAERAEDKLDDLNLGDLNTAAGETQLAALPSQNLTAVTRPKRSGRVINVQPIHDFRGQAKPILTDILRNVLRAVPNAVVISEQPGGDDDVVVSGSVLKFAQREEPNPDYQAAQIAASLFGGLAAAMTANIPPSHTLIDVEVLISAQDATTGERFSESGYANLKLDSRQTNPTQAGFDALQTAVTQAAKRIVIRLTGGTPQQQVTAAEISNDANLKRAIKRFYNKQRFWKSHGSKNRPTEMVDIYDISLASVSDNLIKLDVRYRWQLQDMHAGKNANGIATVERAGNSFRVLDFQ